MLRLDNTTRKLQVVLAGAVATAQLPVMVAYSDKTVTAYTGAVQVSNTNSTVAVDICNSPAASTVRDIDYLSVRNSDTAAATVTIRYNDNAVLYTIVTATLSIGDHLVYVHGDGWKVLDVNGQTKTTALSGLIAANITNTPAGAIVATNVQAALNELDAEKAALVGALFTGIIGIIAGTVAAPGLYISGDTNTGVYSSAADTLDLTIGGVRGLSVNGTTVQTGVIGLEINALGTGDRFAFVDFIGDATYADYGLRIIRGNAGANATSVISHRGTGNFSVSLNEAASFSVETSGVSRLVVDSAGKTTIQGVTFGLGGNAGSTNLAAGTNALSSNTTGGGNVACGFQALKDNTTGYANAAFGTNALVSNTTGHSNTAVGASAMQSSTTGFANTAFGKEAMFLNTSGGANSALGFQAMKSNTSGYADTCMGSNALAVNTTGYSNTAVGASTLLDNTTGFKNTAIGDNSGYSATVVLSTAAECTYIGFNARADANAYSNSMALGANAIITASNQIVLGSMVVSIMTTGLWLGPAGTVAAPALSTSGDTNTGVYFSAADTVDFATGGVNALKLTSTVATFVGAVKSPNPNQQITTGAAAVTGNATLVAGTVTVSTTAVKTASIVMLTRKTSGGTIGTAITYTISNGVSFTINSDNILDTSTFSWLIVDTY